MFEDDTLIAFVDGMVTDQENLTDEMYENASMHHEDGAWQMIFGVNTLPAYRNHGYAGEILKERLQMQKTREEKGLSLRAKTGWCITMQNLDLKTRAFQNPFMEMWSGIRCGLPFKILKIKIIRIW